MKKLVSITALGSGLTLLSLPAYAYLDPGTGSALIQGLIAAELRASPKFPFSIRNASARRWLVSARPRAWLKGSSSLLECVPKI